LQVVILSGGKGTRLYPLTKTIPKCLVSILDKPFFTYQIELLKKNNIFDIVLCVGTFSEQIINEYGDGKKYGVSIRYSLEEPDNLLGTGGALKNASELLNDSFFVMYGDSYLPIDFAKVCDAFKNSNKKALMTIYKNKNEFDKSNVSISGDLVTKYDKSDNKGLEYIDYGLLVLKKQVLEIIPSDKFVNLDLLIQMLIVSKELRSFIVNTRFYEIGSNEGISDFTNYIKSLANSK